MTPQPLMWFNAAIYTDNRFVLVAFMVAQTAVDHCPLGQKNATTVLPAACPMIPEFCVFYMLSKADSQLDLPLETRNKDRKNGGRCSMMTWGLAVNILPSFLRWQLVMSIRSIKASVRRLCSELRRDIGRLRQEVNDCASSRPAPGQLWCTIVPW